MESLQKKRALFTKLIEDIRSVRIQGARNVAKAALKAYLLFPTKKTLNKLLRLRPTEPMMRHVLALAKEESPKTILRHFSEAQENINECAYSLFSKKEIILTHCHSTNVVNALLYAKKKRKHFEVYNTETRPLYQGRKTAKELTKNNIRVTTFVDAALGVALTKEQGTEKVTKVFLGADALTKKGIINKIGSEVLARIAREENIPVYVLADSWKFTRQALTLEQRDLNEVWDRAPKKVKLKNPAFEFVDKKYLTKIITEKGIMTYDAFVKKEITSRKLSSARP